jgi:A/G-specific adenine glycosylase
MGRIEVAVGIARRSDGALLLGQRKKHMIHRGKWEFPGGKIEPGESPKEALIREWKEELDVDLAHVRFWKRMDFSYEDREVALYLIFCQPKSGWRARVHEAVSWCGPEDLTQLDLLDADREIVRALRDREQGMEDEPLMEQFLDWYRTNARALPWRETQDPYRIWLSEIMLQQTRVETVLDYYRRFLESFPTVEDLAEASDEAVMKAWEGLGYYSRARNLHACAKAVAVAGAFPESYAGLLALPGIGPYTAGAVASFAFDIRMPAVDGNVLRVAARWMGIWDDIMKAPTRKLITDRVAERMPEDVATFNQAMMELGATVCTPKKPDCGHCPLEGDCYARWSGDQAELPVKSKKKKAKRVWVAVAWIHHGDKHLLVKRPMEGLLAGLWGLPVGEGDSEGAAYEALIAHLEETFDLQVKEGRPGAKAEHVFTHRVWDMTAYHFEVDDMPVVDYPPTRILREEEFATLAIPTAFQKIIKKGSR